MKGELAKAETIAVRDGSGVRGTVPQFIRKGVNESVDLMFRSSGVFRNATCVVKCGEKEIARKKAMIFTPGEMAVVKLKPEIVAGLDETVTVSIEGGE